MLDQEISANTRELIQRHLATMDHVEVLAVLRGDPTQSFALQALVDQIRKPETLVAACLDALVAAGLAARLSNGEYRYAPHDPALDGTAEDVVRLYNERPVTLVRLLYERPPTAVNTFADAFRLRKE